MCLGQGPSLAGFHVNLSLSSPTQEKFANDESNFARLYSLFAQKILTEPGNSCGPEEVSKLVHVQFLVLLPEFGGIYLVTNDLEEGELEVQVGRQIFEAGVGRGRHPPRSSIVLKPSFRNERLR